MPARGRNQSAASARPSSRGERARRSQRDSYWRLATRPLHVLAFLAPLIVLYEIGSATVLGPAAGGIQTVRAHDRLARALDLLGVAGAFLPWVVLVTILVSWQVVSRDRWRVRPMVLMGMAAESFVATMPLLVLAALLFGTGAAGGPVGGEDGAGAAVMALAAGAGPSIADLPWIARAVLSIGAGLYEELVFRMILLAAIHLVLADFARVPASIAGGIAIIVSAIAFALYHDPAPGPHAVAQTAFYVLAGVYFGLVAVVRGFGVAVGVHAAYDFLVLVVLGSGSVQ